MKDFALREPALILLAIGVLAAMVYISPTIIGMLPNVPYKMVLFFLIVIFTSNILAKILQAFIVT